jgi:hypothetical protein
MASSRPCRSDGSRPGLCVGPAGQPPEYASQTIARASGWTTRLRPFGARALNPELDVAVLARDPADPRIEAPAPEQPR